MTRNATSSAMVWAELPQRRACQEQGQGELERILDRAVERGEANPAVIEIVDTIFLPLAHRPS